MPPPPQIQTQEKPKIAFETMGAGGTYRTPGQGERRVPMPTNSVAEATRAVARSRSGPGPGCQVSSVKPR